MRKASVNIFTWDIIKPYAGPDRRLVSLFGKKCTLRVECEQNKSSTIFCLKINNRPRYDGEYTMYTLYFTIAAALKLTSTLFRHSTLRICSSSSLRHPSYFSRIRIIFLFLSLSIHEERVSPIHKRYA